MGQSRLSISMANIIILECLTSQLAPRQSVRAIIIIVTHRVQHITLNMQDIEGSDGGGGHLLARVLSHHPPPHYI